MKKLLKKATMLLCAMAVTIGFVGGTVEEVSAASNKVYGGKSKIILSISKGYHDYNVTMTLKDSKKNTLASTTNGLFWYNEKQGAEGEAYVSYKNTKNLKCYLEVSVYDKDLDITVKKEISLNLKDLEKKNFKVSINRTNKGMVSKIKSVTISKVNK